MRLPRNIAGYEFVELLGVGSFGSVYRAVIRGDLGFEQEVAVKVLDAERAQADTAHVAAIANEARILSRVQHPNIVQARHFRYVEDEALGDTWILVMELVRGQSLRRLLKHDRHQLEPLPIAAPLLMISEISDGLHFAHRLRDAQGEPVGLVHRDLKPANIRITNEGRLKILDFGIAWAKRRLGKVTGGGITKGTPLYMSPEQLYGEPLDGRSDLYALGAIAFEFLTGAPYVRMEGGGDESPLQAALEARFEPREPELRWALENRYGITASKPTEKLVSLIRDLLAREPDRRPAEGGEVFDRLEDLWELHRPSLGRGALRAWVEQRNELDAASVAEGIMPTGLAEELGDRPPITATVLLDPNGLDSEADPDDSISPISMSQVEPVPVPERPPPAEADKPWWKF